MSHQAESLIDRLLQAPEWRVEEKWQERQGDYVAACRVSADDIPGLVEIACKWGDDDWIVSVIESCDFEIEPEELSKAAWRSLADLQAGAAVEPLLDMLRSLNDEHDSFELEDLPHVFGKIGEAAFPPLARVAADPREPRFVREVAARGLGSIIERHPETRDRVIPTLKEMMAQARAGDEHFNTTLLTVLDDVHGVEAAEEIERAFAANLLDVAMLGNWEDVRLRLGVEGLGLKMPEKPLDSRVALRRRMGYGIFSDTAVFNVGIGGVDAKAVVKYYERANRVFCASPEGRQVAERHGEPHWHLSLLNYGVDRRAVTIDSMAVVDVQDFLLDYVPCQVTVASDAAAACVDELTAFFKFVHRVYKLPNASEIVSWLEQDGLTERVEAEWSDVRNFGPGKAFVIAGMEAGFDMSTEEGLRAYQALYQQMLVEKLQAANLDSIDTETEFLSPLVRREQRIGRNDPCPCGSGKKFKKCCLRTAP